MAKGSRQYSLRYKYPLPIHPIDDLPPLILHNPISWAYWIYKYIRSSNNVKDKIHVDIIGNRYPRILVKDDVQMLYLWDNGFFGTGQLSRSEPTWKSRTEARLDADDSIAADKSQLTLEKVTQRRRLQRLEFKKMREQLENQLLQLRRSGGSKEQEYALLEREREALRDFKAQQSFHDELDNVATDEGQINGGENEISVREEDSELIDGNGNIKQLEALELMPVEAIFLTFALPVLDIDMSSLFTRLHAYSSGDIEYKNIHNLMIQYVSYHHYRSHGWCVRSGIKFGCDYLLYKRGPPFQHAEFCIVTMDAHTTKDYTWYSSIARVCGGARKTLVLCYVERLISEEKVMALLNKRDYAGIFSSYKINEVTYKRWVPGKNRD
ncbi:tRNA splicing endonuclease subunit SEN2 NDAI_0G02770 [Naumovozyma dairenensis CBS 421]|uniref:tRNA-splicing endonuclease subunit Sen2 n=1 Tax=Naumovozyma dairenensis (strain ATCC 10597 / BCRC 20456 / CBS 421 / NBRC 0211 / NRRL Y-12639) TaxID=1071378 RepID=G0WE43_NAUDC|nr:hypothetical protein NDAI_0G02770 [Naumovozyma dairenensis CBS 421]CCD26054.2 hypothetical protein NDAI_0G02770 [Naumovozyma dairenensis CBS 421]